MATTERPSAMFAWQYTGIAGGLEKHLRYTSSMPLPDDKPNTALVKVLRASLNPADYKTPELPLVSKFIGLPATIGSDFVGRVVSNGIAGFTSGDLVVGRVRPGLKHGTLGEYVAVSNSDPMVKLDESAVQDGKIDELAGIGIAGTTALVSLRGIPAGSRVFINGSSGGTGIYCVQIAKHMGLEVVATCSSRNVEFVRNLGADEVIDYTKGNVVESLLASVERAGGRKFDRVVDNVGSSPEFYWRAHEYLAPSMRFVMVGASPTLTTAIQFLKMQFWPGFLGGGKRPYNFLMNASPTNEELGQVADLIMGGKMRTEMEKFKLDEVPKAIERLRSGRTKGKIIITISEGTA